MIKINWAPVNIPIRRRIQTFTVGVYVFLMLVIGLLSYAIFGILLLNGNIYVKTLIIIYGVWTYFTREEAQNNFKDSGIRWMRNNLFWKHFRDYFPVELIKTTELSPTKNYLLACYPHGVIGIGVFTNMAVDISVWNKLFPKIRPQLATLALHFNTPLWRHLVLAWGMVPVTKKSLLNKLTASHDPHEPLNSDGYTSNAIGIVVGGAQEALNAKPGKYVITIKNRKGFVKLAIQSGAAIVPVFSFGEVDVFDQIDYPPDSLVRKMQVLIKNLTGISPLFIRGRGIFQYNIGLLPQRKRIVQVVGAPIDVQQSDNPQEDEIEEIHQKFTNDLNVLFESHKSKYIDNFENVFLEIQ